MALILTSLKTEKSTYSHNFLFSLQSFYLLPTIDKPTRVHNNLGTLIDNILITDPEQCLVSGSVLDQK